MSIEELIEKLQLEYHYTYEQALNYVKELNTEKRIQI